MRIPARAPTITDLLNRIQAENVTKALSCPDEALHANKYYHWDKLRHLPPPQGLTSDIWWLALKWRRSSQRQYLPLNDIQNQPFSFSLTPTMFEAFHHIDQECAGTIKMPELVTNKSTRDRYYISSAMEEAVTSSLLEGAVTTREKARDMLRSGRNPVNKSERMVLNNYQTMLHLRDIHTQTLTPELVLDIHRRISLKALDKPDAAGRLRRADEHIEVSDEQGTVAHTPPPAGELPARMQAMCDFANERQMTGYLHPVIRAITLHFWLAYDHPFVDGNGRTARALFYWSMLRGGYWLFEFISISQVLLRAPADYYRAFLHTETDENDLNYFLLHQLDCIETAIRDLHSYLDRKTKERKHLRSLLNSMNWLNHRQEALLAHALDHPDAEYTFESHQRSHDLAKMTARKDLTTLEEKGLLYSTWRGKKRLFHPIAGLEGELASAKKA